MILWYVIFIVSLNVYSVYAAEKKSNFIITTQTDSTNGKLVTLEEKKKELQQLHAVLTLFKNPIYQKNHWLNYLEDLLKAEQRNIKNILARGLIHDWRNRHASDLALIEERRRELGAQLHPMRGGTPHEKLELGIIKADYGEYGSGLWDVRSYTDAGWPEAVHYSLRPMHPHSLPVILTLKMIYIADKGPQRPYLIY